MESVTNLDKELEKVLTKFNALFDHSNRTLEELLQQVQILQRDLVFLTSEFSYL